MREYSDEELKLLAEVLPNVARELRGAMANVYAAANRLAPPETREKSEKADQIAAVFLQSYYRMYRVVGNLSAAAELGKEGKFPLTNGDVVGLARTVCERAEALFEAQGVLLTFRSERLSQSIAMDAEMLERLLLNLLSNALKFTPKGGRVEVSVRVTQRRVYLAVSDTGRGIPASKRQHVFDRYLETDALDPPPHGLGLGLALCRRIAEGHGGSIVVESEEGKGTTFTVALPNARARNATLRQPKLVCAGGFNKTLVELSDALDAQAFTHRFMD